MVTMTPKQETAWDGLHGLLDGGVTVFTKYGYVSGILRMTTAGRFTLEQRGIPYDSVNGDTVFTFDLSDIHKIQLFGIYLNCRKD